MYQETDSIRRLGLYYSLLRYMYVCLGFPFLPTYAQGSLKGASLSLFLMLFQLPAIAVLTDSGLLFQGHLHGSLHHLGIILLPFLHPDTWQLGVQDSLAVNSLSSVPNTSLHFLHPDYQASTLAEYITMELIYPRYCQSVDSKRQRWNRKLDEIKQGRGLTQA